MNTLNTSSVLTSAVRSIASTRHNYTAYDCYDSFFRNRPDLRSQLNGMCDALVYNEISRDEFDLRVERLMSRANLNKRSSQAEFLELRTQQLRSIHPDASNSWIKKTAQAELDKLILYQNRRNVRRNITARRHSFSEYAE